MISHPIPPLYDKNSRILILGSFPSVRSREIGFYYGHARNRFWQVLAALYRENVPDTIAEKKDFLLSHGIALWDVIASCEIEGSSDASIRHAIPNDIAALLAKAPISRIFVTGRTAKTLYDRHLRDKLGMQAVLLPSTSPANAALSLDDLITQWQQAFALD